jgi:transcriptional regulator with XRE-family HTH domain
MTLAHSKQHKNDVNSIILANLIELRELYGLNWKIIGEKVGVAPSTISRIFIGKSTGGRQLLAGLELLKELTILKRTGVNQQLAGELETMKQRIEDLQRQISPKYPEHRPQNAALNEPKVTAAEKASDDHVVASAVRKEARASKSAPHRKS